MFKCIIILFLLVSNSNTLFAQTRSDIVRAEQKGPWAVGLGTSPISVNIENASAIVKATATITNVDKPINILISSFTWTNLTPNVLTERIGVMVTNYINNSITANVIVTSFTASNLGISTNTATMQLYRGDSSSLMISSDIYMWGVADVPGESLCVTQY